MALYMKEERMFSVYYYKLRDTPIHGLSARAKLTAFHPTKSSVSCLRPMYVYRTTQIIHRFRGCSICSFYSVSVLQIQYAVGQRGTSVVLSRQTCKP